MTLLNGKRLLVTGVLNDESIAFSVARRVQEEGAEVVLTSFGRVMPITKRVARRLPHPPDVLELDMTVPDHYRRLADELRARWGRVDGILHAVAFAPRSAMGGDFLRTGWDDVATALQVSAYSLAPLASALTPLMPRGSAIVGLDFDASVAWPSYDWMGVAKAALESCARYLARDLGSLGIRVNLVAAGPLRTVAAKSIPGFELFEKRWAERAPLGWSTGETAGVADACVALMSNLFSLTTGEIVHVDGGYHAVGA